MAWNRVRIVWQSFGGAGEKAVLFRRTSCGLVSAYQRSGDGEGRIELEDTDVVSRERYEYWAEQGGLRSESYFTDVPSPLLSLVGARPNPARDHVRIALLSVITLFDGDSVMQFEGRASERRWI